MNETLKVGFRKLYAKVFEEDVLNGAAQVAFYFSFSIFPLALFVVNLFGILLGAADTFKEQLFSILEARMPESAFDLFRVTIEEVSKESSTGKLTFGLLVLIWSASSGIDSLRDALNKVYKFKETRSWWKTRSLSILITFGLSLLITASLAIVFYGRQLVLLLFGSLSIDIESPFLIFFVYWSLSLAVSLLTFEIYYYFLPNGKQFRRFWITPGSLVGIILWYALSYGFRTYLFYYGAYDQIYGPISALIILMFWLYLNAVAILVGGAVNAVFGEVTGSAELSGEEQGRRSPD